MELTLQQQQETPELQQQQKELEDKNKQLAQQASTDSLTGSANRW